MSLVVQNITTETSVLFGAKSFKKISAANISSSPSTLSLYYTGVARVQPGIGRNIGGQTYIEETKTFYIVKNLSIDAGKSAIILEEGLDFKDVKYYDSTGVLYNLFDVKLNAETGTGFVDLIIELNYEL